jgi:hypothetical protein
MLKNILNHKKKLIVVVLLLALIGVSAYVLLNKKSPAKVTTEKASEVSTKEDKKNEVKDDKNTDKKNETKTSDKKEDVKADEKKVDTKAEETSTSTENTTSNVSNNTSTTTNNTTSNTVSNSASNSTPAPCVPTYTTVNHPAVGHYEQREIMPAYTKGVYAEKIVGGQTGRIYNTLDEFYNQDADYSYSLQQVQVGTETVPAEYDNVWVEDQPAYTTTEASGC